MFAPFLRPPPNRGPARGDAGLLQRHQEPQDFQAVSASILRTGMGVAWPSTTVQHKALRGSQGRGGEGVTGVRFGWSKHPVRDVLGALGV